MNNINATWEDEENNRHVHYSVEYTIENGQIEICGVTPLKVSFVCPQSNTVIRKVHVHTTGGRRILNRQIQSSGQIEALAAEIADREGLLATA